MEGRIWFPGNPWPDGHRIETFDWTGRLDDLGRLFFDLTLHSAAYDEAGDEDEGRDDQPDWEAPIVWNNYPRCTISSAFWDDATGLLAATPTRPFRLAGPEPQRLTADPLPVEDLDADPAFRVYLLGHDSVADHTLTFTADGTGGHHIDWIGRIALTYAGDETFRHEFRAEIRGARLARVAPAEGMTDDEATLRVSHLLGLPEQLAARLLTNA
ncbi:hypothetical protein ACIBSW_21935 [Actinoplanes sp. NPDC049668]|uniref:hypothetical protein n=1 Tax=unclassified Actinoplanes TaxID=2626549 RepID=UPI0033A1465D